MPPSPAARRPRKAERDDFVFAAAHLEHDHIFGMCAGLCGAGARLKWVYDRDRAKVRALRERFPGARVAREFDEILGDPAVRLVAAAGVPCDRGPTGCAVMAAGKENYGSEMRFEVGLISGHSYRIQVIAHDGDQNKGGDSGEACATFCAGTGTLCDPGVTECVQDPDGSTCPTDTVCVQGCCLQIVK